MKDINLNNPATYKQYDPQNMLKHIHDVPKLCQEAWQLVTALELPSDYTGVNKIVILGIGGSAIGGDLLAGLVSQESPVPILIQRNYTLPAFVDDNTLVIASSYSGTTTETLSAFELAFKTKAKKLVMTTGGELKKLALESNIPIFSFDYKSPPRAALPFSFIPLIGIMQKLGFIRDKSRDIAETVRVLKELNQLINETSPISQNPAKKLAEALYGKTAAIYGAEFLAEVAHRWKLQINENAKSWACYEVFPELNHNAVTGYQFPLETSKNTMVIMLSSIRLHERIQRRYEITGRILEQAGVKHQVVAARGRSHLAQMMSLILLGDYVSYYLAMLNQTDPYPLKEVEYLKQELSQG